MEYNHSNAFFNEEDGFYISLLETITRGRKSKTPHYAARVKENYGIKIIKLKLKQHQMSHPTQHTCMRAKVKEWGPRRQSF